MKFLSRLFSRKGEAETLQDPQGEGAENSLPVLNLVIFMVDWPIYTPIFSVFEETKVPFYFIHKGRGTAISEGTDLLGIGSSDKAIILCVEQFAKIPALMGEIRKKIGPNRSGAGIAVTIPLSAINNPILRAYIPVPQERVLQRRTSGFPFALIYSVINRGYSEEFMHTAREAGAGGGTILTARYQDLEGTGKFFGISVQEEREIILILSGREKKAAILQAISETHGLESPAQGLIFSIPVDRAMSLSFSQEFNA
ncbi:MAG: hypothetical protein FWH12_07660 [Treponema sp.]|nr:hypothetical protein [Treponema sp.]